MTDISEIKVILASWNDSTQKAQLQEIRERVFVLEQGIDKELEWDEYDAQSDHFLVIKGDVPVGCARLIANARQAKIGRIAVLNEYRSFGIGQRLMKAIEDHCRESGHFDELYLSAQCRAFRFYSHAGYGAQSVPYDDASIAHIDMFKPISTSETEANEQIRYKLGFDEAHYEAKNALEANGYLDLFLCQTQRSINLSIHDLDQPLSKHSEIIKVITKNAKRVRHFQVHILLDSYHPKFNEHPLIEMSRKLSSFVAVRVSGHPITGYWLFDTKGWLEIDGNNARACYGDRARTKHLTDEFKRWWDRSKPVTHSRKLFL